MSKQRAAGITVVFSSLALACVSAGASEIFVTPDGKPDGKGTKESPLDLTTTFTNAELVPPGTTIWIAGGRYEVGKLAQGPAVKGLKDAPIVYRAAPGERATVVGGLEIHGDYTWLWGLEISGPGESGVNLRNGDGIKLINLVVHDEGPAERPTTVKPSGQGIGGWNVGNDHEYYGNLLYHNGWFTLDHGIYSQNTARYTTKRYIDNIIFENAGTGIHVYGQDPMLNGFYLEGNISFATTLIPRGSDSKQGQMNILIGGYKPLTNVVVRGNCTYHPQADSKRGADVGYIGAPNRNIIVEGNYFMCGLNAFELKGVADAIIRNNTFWAPNGMVSVAFAPADKLAEQTQVRPLILTESRPVDPATVEREKAFAALPEPKVLFENNSYIDNGKFNLDQFRGAIKSGETDKLVPGKDGRPTGLHVVKRVNQYEPERVHLAVYNWDHKDVVQVDLPGILKAGDSYRVVNVLDFYGQPVVAGKAQGTSIMLPMKGHRYEPEFGAYVLFREVRK